MPQYEVVPIHFLRRTKRSAEEDQHRELHLSAFGKDLQLNLKPNSDFQERAERMKVIVAETDRDTGKLDYREEKSGPEVIMVSLGSNTTATELEVSWQRARRAAQLIHICPLIMCPTTHISIS